MQEITPEITIFDNMEALTSAAADLTLSIAQKAVKKHGRFLIALSGGSTPLGMYRRLSSSPYAEAMPWRVTHFFWGDERCVPPDDPESNYGQALRTFLGKFSIPPENIQRILGELEPEIAAKDYAERLKEYCHGRQDWPAFDLVLLGLGADGHTASLFPGINPGGVWNSPTLAVRATYQNRPASRVTLTPPVFNSAHAVLFMVNGDDKAHALASTLKGGSEAEILPARQIHPENGRVIWMVEEKAGNLLK